MYMLAVTQVYTCHPTLSLNFDCTKLALRLEQNFKSSITIHCSDRFLIFVFVLLYQKTVSAGLQERLNEEELGVELSVIDDEIPDDSLLSYELQDASTN